MKQILDQIFDDLSHVAGAGLKEAGEKLRDAAGKIDDPLQAYLVRYLGNAVKEQGVEGLRLGRQHLASLLDSNGRLIPEKIRGLPLSERGPLIAIAERQEIDAKKRGDAALTMVGEFFGRLVSGLAKGIFK